MVKTQALLEHVKKARSASSKRNFKQSFELVINLKDIDTKKNEINLNETVFLPNPLKAHSKICVIASGDLDLRAGQADAPDRAAGRRAQPGFGPGEYHRSRDRSQSENRQDFFYRRDRHW